MKPPICEVCGDRFDAGVGALVTCQADEATAAFEERAATPGFVGHPPNQGWFCARHSVAAQHIGPTEPLRIVVDTIRRAEETAVCEICNVVFQKNTAGLVGFEHTPAGTAWHAAMLQGRGQGTSPDNAWLCGQHINPALRVSSHLTRQAAMAELMPKGRSPLEYDERPPSTDPQLDEHAPPLRGPFAPAIDHGLETAEEVWTDYAPQPSPLGHEVIRSVVDDFGDVFGVERFRNGGSTGSASIDPMDIRWAPAGSRAGASISPYESGDLVVFVIHQHFREGNRTGPIIQSGLRFLVQRRGQSLFEMVLVPATIPTVAPDGLVMLERLLVRQRPDLLPNVVEGLNQVAEALRSQLLGEAPNPFDPAPDLIGVDLGTGSIKRFGNDGDSRIVWRSSDGFASLMASLVEVTPRLLHAVGVDTPLSLTETTKRDWSPMDGSRPPHCPFVDTTTWSGTVGSVSVSIQSTSAFWSDEDLSNRSANMYIAVDDDVIALWISEDRPSGNTHPSHSRPSDVALHRPTSAAVVAVVRAVFGL